MLYTTCLIHTHIHTVCLFVFLYWSTFYLTFRHLHCHPTGFKPTWEPPNKQEGDCVYLRASIHTWGNWGDRTHQRPQVNLIRKQCTSHKTLSKKTQNKETETQTYKLDAKKEYDVFVGGGEGFFFPLHLWVREQVLTFYFSLRIFGILEWIILNKRKYLWGVFLKLHPLESCFEQKVTQRWESCLSEVIFLGCFPLYLVYIYIYIFLLKILFQLFTGSIAALLKVWVVTL